MKFHRFIFVINNKKDACISTEIKTNQIDFVYCANQARKHDINRFFFLQILNFIVNRNEMPNILYIFGINNFPCVHRCTVPKNLDFYFFSIFLCLSYNLPRKKILRKKIQLILTSIGKIWMNFSMKKKLWMKMSLYVFLMCLKRGKNYDVM